MALDPQIAVVLEQRQAAGLRPIAELTPSEARAQLKAAASQRPAAMPKDACRIDDLLLEVGERSIPARRYAQHLAVEGTIVYYHGGGWVLGELDDFDQLCLALATASRCELFSIAYRLAPEHPFPAAALDAYAALVAVSAECGGAVVVGGDSAGGNLAAVAALQARAAGGPAIKLQVLIYPITDHDLERSSYRQNGSLGYILTTQDMRWFWDHYVSDSNLRCDPLASPLRADDLRGLPPAFIVVSEYDPLRDEGVAYAARLREAGVPVELREYDGTVHGFLGMLSVVDVADEAIQAVARVIRSAVNGTSTAGAMFTA